MLKQGKSYISIILFIHILYCTKIDEKSSNNKSSRRKSDNRFTHISFFLGIYCFGGDFMKMGRVRSLFWCSVYGLIVGLAVIFALTLLFSFVTLKTGNPARIIFALSLICVFFGGFSGAFCSAKLYKETPLSAGLLSGVFILLIMLAVSVIMPAAPAGFTQSVTPMAVLTVAAVFGTLAAANMKTSDKKRMKKLLK